MEELAEGLLKATLRALGLLIRFLIWLIMELFFEVTAWYVGWPICRALSLGNWPRQSIGEHELAAPLTRFTVSVVGILTLLGIVILLAKLTGSA